MNYALSTIVAASVAHAQAEAWRAFPLKAALDWYCTGDNATEHESKMLSDSKEAGCHLFAYWTLRRAAAVRTHTLRWRVCDPEPGAVGRASRRLSLLDGRAAAADCEAQPHRHAASQLTDVPAAAASSQPEEEQKKILKEQQDWAGNQEPAKLTLLSAMRPQLLELWCNADGKAAEQCTPENKSAAARGAGGAAPRHL